MSSVVGNSTSIPESAFRLDFTSLVRQTPADTDYVVPACYARATTLGDVIGNTLSGI